MSAPPIPFATAPHCPRLFGARGTLWAVLIGFTALAAPAWSALEPMGAEQMDAAAVSSSGISFLLANTDIRTSATEVSVTDPVSGSTLVLRDVVISDGAGGGASWDTLPGEANTIDVISDAATGVAALALRFNRQYPHTVEVGQLVLDGHDLGSLELRDLWQRRSELLVSGHADGSAGLSAALASEGSLGELRLSYNDAGDSLLLAGIHWGGVAEGPPEDPGQWRLTGPLQVGSLPDNPITLDVVAGAVDASIAPPSPHVQLNLPFSGTVRVEEIALGNQSFGPLALDGVQVHSLTLRLTPPSP